MKTVVEKFFDSLVDLSVNEKSIHYAKTTDVLFDGVYSRFEHILLKASLTFTKKILEIAHKKKRLSMIDSVLTDYAELFNGIPAKSLKDIEKMRSETVIKFVRFLVKARHKKFLTSDFEKVEAKAGPDNHEVCNRLFVEGSKFSKVFSSLCENEQAETKKFQLYFLL